MYMENYAQNTQDYLILETHMRRSKYSRKHSGPVPIILNKDNYNLITLIILFLK